LRVAYHPWPGYAPLRLAESLGWWNGTPFLQGVHTHSASASRAALQSGQAEVAALTLDETLRACAQGLPLQVVALFNLSYGADVVLARPGLPVNHWRGARLGLEAGSVGELMASSWLQHAGLEPDAIERVHLPIDQQEAAWQRGDIDLLVTCEPVATRLQRAGAQRLYDSSALPPDRPIIDVLAAHRKALLPHTAALRTLVAHVFDAQRHLHYLPEDSSYRLAPWLQLPRTDVLSAFAGLRLLSLSDNRDWLLGSPAPLQRAAAGLAVFLHAHDLLPSATLPDEFIVANYLSAALLP